MLHKAIDFLEVKLKLITIQGKELKVYDLYKQGQCHASYSLLA